jgi:SAM-dependent methyltransferase
MKESLELKKVVLLGRTLDEYARYFGLDLNVLSGQAVLDIASGVSSFCAEANERGIAVTAFDLIYEFDPGQIRAQCEPDLDFVVAEIGKVKAYKWDFYKSPAGMRAYREVAYKKFLADYAAHRERYVAGRLPKLPFPDGHFDLALASYLLFVYEEQPPFNYEFHKQSLLEIMRVTRREARIYPLVNFRAERCSFVDRIKADPELRHLQFAEVKTDFEFLAGSNYYLQIRRAS